MIKHKDQGSELQKPVEMQVPGVAHPFQPQEAETGYPQSKLDSKTRRICRLWFSSRDISLLNEVEE